MINFKKYGKRCLSLFLAASMILMRQYRHLLRKKRRQPQQIQLRQRKKTGRHSVRTVMRSHQIQTVWRTGHRDRQLMRIPQSLWI